MMLGATGDAGAVLVETSMAVAVSHVEVEVTVSWSIANSLVYSELIWFSISLDNRNSGR